MIAADLQEAWPEQADGRSSRGSGQGGQEEGRQEEFGHQLELEFDYARMVTGDMEAIKKFVFVEHHEEAA